MCCKKSKLLHNHAFRVTITRICVIYRDYSGIFTISVFQKSKILKIANFHANGTHLWHLSMYFDIFIIFSVFGNLVFEIEHFHVKWVTFRPLVTFLHRKVLYIISNMFSRETIRHLSNKSKTLSKFINAVSTSYLYQNIVNQ